MLERELKTLLVAAGTGAADRVYADGLPDSPTYPAISVSRVSAFTGQTLDGPEGITTARVQVDVYALSYGEMRTVAGQVVSALNGFTGVLGETVLYWVNWERDSDLSELDGDKRIRRASLDFAMSYSEGN